MAGTAPALLRLQASRLLLRQALLPAAVACHDASGTEAQAPRRWRALWRCWRQRLRRSPVAGMAMAAAQAWWWQQPWRESGTSAAVALRDAVGPVVRRHPVATVLLAGGAGAVLIVWRPWRWPVVARRLSPLPRQLGHWLLAQLSQPAVQSMLGAWLLSTLSRPAAGPSPAPAAADPGDGQKS